MIELSNILDGIKFYDKKKVNKLSETEMRQLVDQLFATSMPYVCPHGRPIVIKIPLGEFDKRFGRT